MTQKAFGTPRTISGAAFTGAATSVPLEMLDDLKPKKPLSCAVSGTSNRTFTLTGPVSLWSGNDIFHLTAAESLSYSWVVGSNAILDSTGAATTLTNGTLGIWYMYVGINSAGTQVMLPSQTAPAATEGPKNSGYFGHPGTSKANFFHYVGFMLCDATTPTFVTMTKTGYSYLIKESEKLEQVTTDTSYAALAFTGAEALPTHTGVTVGGWIETAAGDTVKLAYDADGSGVVLATGATGDVGTAPFSGMPLNSGDMYALHGSAAGDVHVSQIVDVI